LDAALICLLWYVIAVSMFLGEHPGGDFYHWLKLDVFQCFSNYRPFHDFIYWSGVFQDLAAEPSVVYASLFAFIFAWGYSAAMEAGPWQATLGKRVLGIRVADVSTKAISPWRAIVRGISKTVSVIPALSGVFAIGLSADKRSFHDRLCQTIVIKDGHRYLFKKKESPMQKATRITITNSQGVVLSLAEHMENVSTQVSQNLERSDQSPEIIQLVKLLGGQIKGLSEKVPADSLEKMTKNVTRLSEELAAKSPDRDWCKLTLSGLKEAAEAVGALGAPIVEIVSKLWPLILG